LHLDRYQLTHDRPIILALGDDDFEGEGRELMNSKTQKWSKQQEPCLKIYDGDIRLMNLAFGTGQHTQK